jgi:hypothetical protein
MGPLHKCSLRLETAFWPGDVDWMEWVGPKDGAWSECVSLTLTLKAPIPLGFNAGAQARLIEPLDGAGTIASALSALRARLGPDLPQPKSAQITRWGSDPSSFGSYSFDAVGASGKDRRALGGDDWKCRLISTGEACAEKHFGTVHRAYLSGRAAAKLLL